MTATTIRVQMAQRKDTAANWTAANPILLSGEIGYETDTKKFKIGDGTTNWNSLAYLPIPDGSGNLTVTGNLEIGTTGTLTFEGSTADGYETTLAVTDPTADRTITLPNVSGTVVTTGDTGSVTSTMIADGTIVNADVSATAEIAVSKLANGTANQVLVTDGTDVSWSDDLTLAGNLTVNGTTTTVNTETLVVEDKNIELGVVGTPTDLTADGGGITLKGTTDKTINWVDATDSWTSSEHVDLASGKSYRINGTEVLSSTTLGSGVTGSSLTSVGTLGSLTVTGSATAGSFIPTSSTVPTNGVYLPAANSVALSTNGTGRLFVDASGNVGFNATPETSTGRTVLTFNGTSGNEIRLNTNGTQSLALITASGIGIIRAPEATGYLRFDTGGTTERLRIDSLGRVGIGTTNPAALLHLESSSPIIQLEDTDASGAYSQINGNGSGGRILLSADAGNTGTNSTIEFAVDGTERARIDSLGRVGIGTASPSTTLTQTNQSTATIAAGINFYNSSGVSGGLIGLSAAGSGGGSDSLSVQGTSTLAFRTASAERARIDSSGRLLVGTSSDSGGALLQVNGDRVRIATAKTPASASATGTAGEVCWDTNYIYVCTATNTWKRAALSTW